MTDLMIILGCPASGKTSLARRLAAELTVPILSKNDIKEALFDVLGFADRERSRRLSDACFAAQKRDTTATCCRSIEPFRQFSETSFTLEKVH